MNKLIAANNYIHSDNKKRCSSFLIAILFVAGDVKRYELPMEKYSL